MGRAVLVLSNDQVRTKAINWIRKAPDKTRVVFQGPVRTLDQNSKLWASLSDIAEQVPWHGMKLTPEDWKTIFIDSLKKELRMVPNIDGNGMVSLGRSSSDLSTEEFSQLLELVLMFCAKHNVTLHYNAYA